MSLGFDVERPDCSIRESNNCVNSDCKLVLSSWDGDVLGALDGEELVRLLWIRCAVLRKYAPAFEFDVLVRPLRILMRWLS